MSEPTDTTPQGDVAVEAASGASVVEGRGVALKGRSLRQHTAQGTIINGLFAVGLAALSFLKTFMVAAFLTANEYGTWGLIVATLVSVAFLIDLGIGDKYIQQTEQDEEAAFQKAFTLNLLVNMVALVLLAALVPLIAALIDRGEIVVPGLVLLAVLPMSVFLSPLWVYYRRMQFVRQRTLQAVDPIVGIIVTVVLAVAGLGVWALVIGQLAGSFSAAALAIAYSPYRIRWRFDPKALREYFNFSWPLLFANLSRLAFIQAAVFVGEWKLGLAAAGAITLAAAVSQFTDKADLVVTQTLYPAICAVQDRKDLLFESFVKSNRLALMWGMPFGLGLALFAPDLVNFVLGADQWEQAIVLLQAFGAIAAFNHLGFNWDAFFRARGDTKPIAWVAGMTAIVYLTLTIPLMATEGLDGFAVGIGIQTVVVMVARTWFLTRLFDGFQMAKHAVRAIVPSVFPVAAVLLMRVLESGPRTEAMAVAEVAVYVGTTILATLYFERVLLREVLGYLRRVRVGEPATV
jgi:O-antigen/teichoic acid export membrane protein